MNTPTSPLVKKGHSVSDRGWLFLVVCVLIGLPLLGGLVHPAFYWLAVVVVLGTILTALAFSMRDPQFRRQAVHQAAIGTLVILALVGVFVFIQ